MVTTVPKVPQAGTRTLPPNLQTGIEALSGMSLNDVRVHYNSGVPFQQQAQAYTQGNDIHLSPGQERHLPHEAWHVVQQRPGPAHLQVPAQQGLVMADIAAE
jgi:hypothetical protein